MHGSGSGMTELFTKSANELAFEHVEQLVGIATENHTTEFKAGLSVESGGKHPWQTGKSRKIDAHARDDVLKEVVAFANSDGGNIVIGMAQSRDAEHRATKVLKIPECKVLAD